MLMGDTPEIPWRLLNIEFLMEDYETGGKESFCMTFSRVLIISILSGRLSYFNLVFPPIFSFTSKRNPNGNKHLPELF